MTRANAQQPPRRVRPAGRPFDVVPRNPLLKSPVPQAVSATIADLPTTAPARGLFEKTRPYWGVCPPNGALKSGDASRIPSEGPGTGRGDPVAPAARDQGGRTMFSSNKRRQIPGKRRSTRERLSLELLESRVNLSTFHVNTLLDTVAVNLKTGKDASGHISLRSAIEAANAHKGADTIVVPAGTYTLSIAGANEDGDLTGDLDVSGPLTVKGSGAASTIVNGNHLDRVFQVLSGKVSISGLTIEGGLVQGNGGGLLNSGGQVTLSKVTVSGNESDGAPATGVGLPLPGNAAAQPAATPIGVVGGLGSPTPGEGGGIFNAAGSLTLINCTVGTNRAVGAAGTNGAGGAAGVGASGTAASIAGQNGSGGNGGAGGQGSDGEGGGIFNASGASLTIEGSSISQNVAQGGAGGVGGPGGFGQGGAGFSNPTPGGVAGRGGQGIGGNGGIGGQGADGLGGGLFNAGTLTLKGAASSISANDALGGSGGNGGRAGNALGGAGGNGQQILTGEFGANGGEADAGKGGGGNAGGNGEGGGIFNSSGGRITSTAGLAVQTNSAVGGQGGAGRIGGFATGGAGGSGGDAGQNVNQATGGEADGGTGGFGGFGGFGNGGGIDNAAGATLTLEAIKNAKNPASSAFTNNAADGGGGGFAANGGGALGGAGGSDTPTGASAASGDGGVAVGGTGGFGGSGISGRGAGLFNGGTASFIGVTVSFTANVADGAPASAGGAGGDAQGGKGGGGIHGGSGGEVAGGSGGSGGFGGNGQGGGIFVDVPGTLIMKPRKGAKKGSGQSSATDLITTNRAAGGPGAIGGAPSTLSFGGAPGTGSSSSGTVGKVIAALPGAAGTAGASSGGGIAILGTATIDNTSITGNQATTDPNVEGTFST